MSDGVSERVEIVEGVADLPAKAPHSAVREALALGRLLASHVVSQVVRQVLHDDARRVCLETEGGQISGKHTCPTKSNYVVVG